MKRYIGLVAMILLICSAVLPTAALAGEGGSSIDDETPVRHMFLLRSGRFEIQPIVGFGINETFEQSIGFGGSLAYYFTNYLGVGASFSYVPLHLGNEYVDEVSKDDYPANVRQTLAIAHPEMIFDVGLIYAPILGKFSLFGWVLNYDLHLYGGFGALIMSSACAAGGGQCNEFKNKDLEGPKFAGVAGLGVRFFFNNFVAMNLEYRAFLSSYAEFSRGTNDDKSGFHAYHYGMVGLSLFFPTSVYMSR